MPKAVLSSESSEGTDGVKAGPHTGETETTPQHGFCPSRRETKRNAILSAARELFSSVGFPETNMDAVSAKANVSKATLYSYFPSKSDLFAAVLNCAAEQYIKVPEELFDVPVEEGLRRIADRLLELILDPGAVGIYRALVSHGRQFPEMVHAFNSVGPKAISKAVSAYFAEQDRRGTLRAPDPELTALLFIHMVKSRAHAYCLLGIEVDRAEIQRVVDEAIRIVLCAYAPNKKSVN